MTVPEGTVAITGSDLLPITLEGEEIYLGGPTYPKAATFRETFSGPLSSRWELDNATVNAGMLELLPSGSSQNWASVQAPGGSNDNLDIADSEITFEFIPGTAGSTDSDAYLGIGLVSSTTQVHWFGFAYRVRGVGSATLGSYGFNNTTSVTYDPTNHRWLRISAAADILYLWTSPDAITWAQFASVNYRLLAGTSNQVFLDLDYGATSLANAVPRRIDNLNAIAKVGTDTITPSVGDTSSLSTSTAAPITVTGSDTFTTSITDSATTRAAFTRTDSITASTTESSQFGAVSVLSNDAIWVSTVEQGVVAGSTQSAVSKTATDIIPIAFDGEQVYISGPVRPKAVTFKESFSGPVGSNWEIYNATVNGGSLELLPTGSTERWALAQAPAGRNNTLDINSSEISFEYIPGANGTVAAEAYLGIGLIASSAQVHWYGFSHLVASDGTATLGSYGFNNASTVPFSPTSHRWFKISAANDVLSLWTSPDGVAWTQFVSTNYRVAAGTSNQVFIDLDYGVKNNTSHVPRRIDNINSMAVEKTSSDAISLTLVGELLHISGPVRPKAETFSENFSAPLTSTWELTNASATNGRLELLPAGSVDKWARAQAPAGRNNTLDISNSQVVFEFIQPAASTSNSTFRMGLGITSSTTEVHWYGFNYSLQNGEGRLGSYGFGDASTVPYNPTAHRWFRISADNDVLYLSTSPDAINWTQFKSTNYRTSAGTSSQAILDFDYGVDNVATSTPQRIDNINSNLVTKTGSDTVTLTITEQGTIVGSMTLVAGSDAITASVAEASVASTEVTTLSGSDTVSVTATDTKALSVRFTKTDSLSVSVTEGRQFSSENKASTESFTASLTETSSIFTTGFSPISYKTSADTVSVFTGEIAGSKTDRTAADTATVSITETSSFGLPIKIPVLTFLKAGNG